MSDERPSQKAAEYIRLISAEYGHAQAEDVLCEIACAYLVWLGTEYGREEIDRLMRERVSASLVRRNHRKIELVVNNGARVG